MLKGCVAWRSSTVRRTSCPIEPPTGVVVGDVAEHAAGFWLERQPGELIDRGNNQRRTAMIDLIIGGVGRNGDTVCYLLVPGGLQLRMHILPDPPLQMGQCSSLYSHCCLTTDDAGSADTDRNLLRPGSIVQHAIGVRAIDLKVVIF